MHLRAVNHLSLLITEYVKHLLHYSKERVEAYHTVALAMKRFSETICNCKAAADIDFATVMATKGIKVITTIHTLFNSADLLFRRIGYEVVIEQLMDFPGVSLEVGAI